MTDIEKLAKARSKDWNLLKLAEECGELTQAVTKFCSDETPEARQAIIEEMVDVIICIETVKNVLEISDSELTDMRHWKMVRNLQRIGEVTANDKPKRCT